MAARHEEGCYWQKVSMYVMVSMGLSDDDVWVSRDTIFQEIRPGAGFKTGGLVEEKGVGGATAERLTDSAISPTDLHLTLFGGLNRKNKKNFQ